MVFLFQIFTPCDFIAAITQHIPDKSFQLVRYYGWYSNKMRGQRKKRAEEENEAEEVEEGVEVIDVSEHQPRRIPSKKWRDLIKSKIPIAKQIGKSLGSRSPHLSRLSA